MQLGFSKVLKTRLIKYLAEKYSVIVSSEKAEEFLRSLADLFLAFSDSEDLGSDNSFFNALQEPVSPLVGFRRLGLTTNSSRFSSENRGLRCSIPYGSQAVGFLRATKDKTGYNPVLSFDVRPEGIEPSTSSLKGNCSTN